VVCMRHMSISPAQCRAARGLVDLTQDQLAKLSGVSKRTIAGFETERTVPIPANLRAIRHALEMAGVRFINFGVDRAAAEPAETS
jgi:transcriptional regulator with XRE-family HTH domain